MKVVRDIQMPPCRFQEPEFGGSGSFCAEYPELTKEQLAAIRKIVADQRPANFRLTPISELGW